MTKERYTNLDGLRAYACIGIVLTHINTNGGFEIPGFIFTVVIPLFTDFTYLFMMISAFSLCCGYYERFVNGNIDIEQFYKKRYQRIWPFFALFCTLELVMDFSLETIYEWFADITLVFGLIPDNNIEVVGVGWFLGTIFVFYMLFPFFIFLISSKKRAWISLIVAIMLHVLCTIRFTLAERKENIIYCSMFFLCGGLLYIYRNECKKIKAPAVIILLVAILLYYSGYGREYSLLVWLATTVVLCISCTGMVSGVLFRNRAILFLASISMEVYLCHMFVYRTLERFNFTHIFSNQLANYLFDTSITIVGAIGLAYIAKVMLRAVDKQVKNLMK